MHRRAVFVAMVAAVLPAARGSAEIMDLGAGWQADVPPEVDLFVTYSDADLRIVIAAEIVHVGDFGPVDIIFTQTAADNLTATRVIISEATIANDTGVDWIGFLMGTGDGATFDEAASRGFASTPFETTLFFDPAGHVAVFFGGVLPDGDVWNPGSGAGGLRIDVDLGTVDDDAVSFLLRQQAIPIPTPGTLALLAVGGLLGVARRRRS